MFNTKKTRLTWLLATVFLAGGLLGGSQFGETVHSVRAGERLLKPARQQTPVKENPNCRTASGKNVHLVSKARAQTVQGGVVQQPIYRPIEGTLSVKIRLESPNQKKIREALTKKVDFEFIDMELGEVFRFISDRYEIPIRMRKSFYDRYGDMTVTLVVSGISLESALNLIVEEDEGVLDFIIEDDVLKIMDGYDAYYKMETHVYDVQELTDWDGVDPEVIAEVIRNTIAPDSWRSDDGNSAVTTQHATPAERKEATIEVLPGRLIVTQSQRVHRQIDDLLLQLVIAESWEHKDDN